MLNTPGSESSVVSTPLEKIGVIAARTRESKRDCGAGTQTVWVKRMNCPVGVLRLVGATVLLAFLCSAKGSSAISVFLRHPNYRGWILPGEREAEVEIGVTPYEHGYQPRDLRLRLELSAGSYHRTVERRGSDGTNLLAIAVKGAAPGDAVLKATVHSRNRELASRTWPLRILTASEAAGLKVYVDRANRLIVDGRPFFPLGWYGSVNEDQLAEIADSPFNCLLAYGTDLVPAGQMRHFLDRMQAAGLRLVYCLNDVYPTATYLEGKSWEGIRGNDAIAAAVVAAYRDHPAVLAWYLNDELPHALAPRLEDYYHRVQSGDPAHPCFIVLCNRSELPYFPQTTDILGVDPYPIPREPVTRVADFVTAARQAVRDNQPVWLVPQAFAWYQYNSKNPDRGHVPSDEELRTGRAPTHEEERCMTYLGLINGAKGLIYYCYYDLRVLPQYREMWGWMKIHRGGGQDAHPSPLVHRAGGGLESGTNQEPCAGEPVSAGEQAVFAGGKSRQNSVPSGLRYATPHRDRGRGAV